MPPMTGIAQYAVCLCQPVLNVIFSYECLLTHPQCDHCKQRKVCHSLLAARSTGPDHLCSFDVLARYPDAPIAGNGPAHAFIRVMAV